MTLDKEAIVNDMLSNYDKMFGSDSVIEEIHHVVEALERGEPILHLLENSRGSFSTIFQPFHAGAIMEDGKQIRDIGLPKPCMEFMERCAKIESLTDELPPQGIEPDENIRAKLLNILRDFLEHFPSKKDMLAWRSHS